MKRKYFRCFYLNKWKKYVVQYNNIESIIINTNSQFVENIKIATRFDYIHTCERTMQDVI